MKNSQTKKLILLVKNILFFSFLLLVINHTDVYAQNEPLGVCNTVVPAIPAGPGHDAFPERTYQTPNMTEADCRVQGTSNSTHQWVPTGGTGTSTVATCAIQSAKFTPSGDQASSWYTDKNPPTVRIDVTGNNNCSGKTVEISIVEIDSATGAFDDDIAQLDNTPMKFSSANSFSITLTAGETECENTPLGNANDCKYYIKVYNPNGSNFVSDGKSGGNLNYECDGVCAQSWSVGAIGNGTTLTGTPVVFCQYDSSGNPQNPSTAVNAPCQNAQTPGTYTLLAPITKDTESFDTRDEHALGNYLNIMIRIFIGICAVLAMLMIVIGGLEYMTSELISSKEHGKDRIMNAILGLLLALGSYALLNTINPDLLKVDVNIKEVTLAVIDYPDAGDGSVDPDFAKGIRTYSSSASVSPGVVSAVTKLKQGWQISGFVVYTNNRMLINLSNGPQTDNTNIIDIAPGTGGYAPVGQGKQGDKKTPLGNWKIADVRYDAGKAQFNKTGSNMGAAFWHLNAMTTGERGIGMHGNKNGTLGATYGCIRLKNADILALQPYVRTGIPVIIR